MYKILYCSDLHGKEDLYNKLLDFSLKGKIKAIVIGGDICPHVHVDLELGIKYQRDFIEGFLFGFFKKVNENNIELFIMLGNDDFRVNHDLLEKAEKEGLVKLLHNKLNKIYNKNIIGYCFVPPMPFLLKDWEKLDDARSKQLTDPSMDIRTVEKDEGTIEEDLLRIGKLAKPTETIYVMHSPPFDTSLDVTGRGDHVGSCAIKEFIKREKPLLTLHGHIHESYEVTGKFMEKIGKTICVNPGSEHLHDKLRLVVIDLDDLKIELKVI